MSFSNTFRYATLRRVRVTIVAVEQQLSTTYSEGVFIALVTQKTKRMRRIVMCGQSGYAAMLQ